jgi:uncharacterized Ntn-hydrolase superfamily protein
VLRAGTFSIVAADPETGEVGVAVQSKYFAVGNVVPWATAGVGAVATQAAGVAAYGPRTLAALRDGLTPQDALLRVLADDEGRETRQLGVVTAAGDAAAWTGSECNPWAGHIVGEGYAAQGNIVAGEAVVQEMGRAWEETAGTMAERLVAALEAGQDAGGDNRGQQSAAVYVERAGAAAETRDALDRTCDLRVDDHEQPIAELRRLVDIHLRWDALSRASAHHEPGRFEQGIAILAAAHERFPDDGTILYDLACYESMAGRPDESLRHLARSLELEPSYRDMARGDTDFEPVRDDDRFRSIVG